VNSRRIEEGNPALKRIIRISLGVTFIFLGIPSLILPVLPGWVFLALGLLLLSVDLPFFERLVKWLEKRVPWIKEPVERLRQSWGDSQEQKKS
jgi:uncharacterized membrane protein YbaN (DUF454 family)